ncbi:hypothetical protein ACFQDN_22175 [Pseudomonas asuensis]|uniref:Uncharacterized protein n=1 Tax=Pseudomonas asuensis TaxID=1825787 RepID=A0ABQ2H1A4_9PSED|nr:hypothetical protein [Pseudomonas asuensis]GGM25883.1 hypothetical protein GCM10009425_40780 [Pseudomonas asuensis]
MKKSWGRLKSLWQNLQFDIEGLREDARKIGQGMIIAGFVGWLIPSDKLPESHSQILFAVGLVLWVFGLIKRRGESE